MGIPGISLDADEQGEVGLAVEILVFISSMWNLKGFLRSGSQVQIREWIRSGYHSKSSVTNNKTNNRRYREDGNRNNIPDKQ